MKNFIYLVLFSLFVKTNTVFAETTSLYTTESLQEKAASKLNPSGIWTIDNLMSRGINAMVMFMGTIALALVVYAGFLWMTASGNESKIEKAKTIMIWTVLGTMAIGASYVFVNFIINVFG